MRRAQILSALLLCLLPSLGLAQDLVPQKRLVLSQDIDLPGGDIGSAFDTTLEACERACIANTSCEAFTFNTRNGSCFLKAGAGEPAPYAGAFSGFVLAADAGASDRAKLRRGELAFVQDWELGAVTAQAGNLANEHVTGTWAAGELMAAARDAEMQGDFAGAAWYMGAAINLTDAAADWAEYARLLVAAGDQDGVDQQSFRDRGYQAAVNAYLRADGTAERHTILVTLERRWSVWGAGAIRSRRCVWRNRCRNGMTRQPILQTRRPNMVSASSRTGLRATVRARASAPPSRKIWRAREWTTRHSCSWTNRV